MLLWAVIRARPRLSRAARLGVAAAARLQWRPTSTAGGRRNGWSSKAAFAGLSLAILALLNLVVRGAAALDRADPRPTCAGGLLWFVAMALVFMLVISALVVRANQGGEAHLARRDRVWPLLGGYGAFVVGWGGRRRPAAPRSAGVVKDDARACSAGPS